MLASAIIALSVVSSIQTPEPCFDVPDDWCLVDTVKVADCVPLNFNYAIGETQTVYWKDCYGFTYSHDFQPDYSWDWMVLVDDYGDDCNTHWVENSGGIYTEFEACGDWKYAYFFEECDKNCDTSDCDIMPEPTSAALWCLVGLFAIGRRPKRVR